MQPGDTVTLPVQGALAQLPVRTEDRIGHERTASGRSVEGVTGPECAYPDIVRASHVPSSHPPILAVPRRHELRVTGSELAFLDVAVGTGARPCVSTPRAQRVEVVS